MPTYIYMYIHIYQHELEDPPCMCYAGFDSNEMKFMVFYASFVHIV